MNSHRELTQAANDAEHADEVDAELTRAQRVLVSRMPNRAADIERESREWKVICRKCGANTDYWTLGGVRYKAKSKGKFIRRRCQACGRRSWNRVERQPSLDGA